MDDEILREVVIQPLVVPKKWTSAVEEGDLDDLNDDTKKIILRMSQLQHAVNFVIEAQVQCREYQIVIAAAVNRCQEQILNLRRSSKQVNWYGSAAKWVLIIVLAAILQEVVKRILGKTGP